MRMSRGLWIAAAVVIAACVGAGYWLLSPPTVFVTSPRLGPAVQAVYATGTVEPVVMLPVAPRIGARIVQLVVDEGAVVKAGQVLARLESEDIRNNVAQLVAQEDFAHRDFLRDAALVKGGIIARQTYDKAEVGMGCGAGGRRGSTCTNRLYDAHGTDCWEDHPSRRRGRAIPSDQPAPVLALLSFTFADLGRRRRRRHRPGQAGPEGPHPRRRFCWTYSSPGMCSKSRRRAIRLPEAIAFASRWTPIHPCKSV